MNRQDIEFMRLALDEARKGQGRTTPNPCVGAVIVRDRSVVGRGYHHRAGTPHAEVNALVDAGGAAAGSTIYVTLEPCNHTGRTPPCTRAIAEAGISRVVVGMEDPNPQVAGGGNAYLRSRGIEVDSGVLADECHALNRPFIKHIETGLPWVVMKAGMSLDGKISYQPGQGGKITGEQARLQTHRLRNSFDAILIGVETALIDNPSLTTRLPHGESSRDPVRVVIDTHLRLDPESVLMKQQSPAQTLIYCSLEASNEKENQLVESGAVVNRIATGEDGRLKLTEILSHLGQSDINSVLVEGGAAVHGSFFSSNLVDEFYIFVAPFFVGEQGTSLVTNYFTSSSRSGAQLYFAETEQLGADLMIHGFVKH